MSIPIAALTATQSFDKNLLPADELKGASDLSDPKANHTVLADTPDSMESCKNKNEDDDDDSSNNTNNNNSNNNMPASIVGPTVISKGDRFPSVHVRLRGEVLETSQLFADSVGVIFGVSGAFSPHCSAHRVPDFKRKWPYMRAAGVTFLGCLAVNDPFVLKGWSDTLKVTDEIVFLADPAATLSTRLGLLEDLSSLGMGMRTRRFVLIVGPSSIVQWIGLDDESSAKDVLKHLSIDGDEALKGDEESSSETSAEELVESSAKEPDSKSPARAATRISWGPMGSDEDWGFDPILEAERSKSLLSANTGLDVPASDEETAGSSSRPTLTFGSSVRGWTPDDDGGSLEERSKDEDADRQARKALFQRTSSKGNTLINAVVASSPSRGNRTAFYAQCTESLSDSVEAEKETASSLGVSWIRVGDKSKDGTERSPSSTLSDPEFGADPFGIQAASSRGSLRSSLPAARMSADARVWDSKSFSSNKAPEESGSGKWRGTGPDLSGGSPERLSHRRLQERPGPDGKAVPRRRRSIDVKCQLERAFTGGVAIGKETDKSLFHQCSLVTLLDTVGASLGDEELDIEFAYFVAPEVVSVSRAPASPLTGRTSAPDLAEHQTWNVEVRVPAGAKKGFGHLLVDGQELSCRKFHFHSPAVHRFSGDSEPRPMELHIIHTNGASDPAKRVVAVVCITFVYEPEVVVKSPCEFVNDIIDAVESEKFISDGSLNLFESIDCNVDLQTLIAENTLAAFYRYETEHTHVDASSPRDHRLGRRSRAEDVTPKGTGGGVEILDCTSTAAKTNTEPLEGGLQSLEANSPNKVTTAGVDDTTVDDLNTTTATEATEDVENQPPLPSGSSKKRSPRGGVSFGDGLKPGHSEENPPPTREMTTLTSQSSGRSIGAPKIKWLVARNPIPLTLEQLESLSWILGRRSDDSMVGIGRSPTSPFASRRLSALKRSSTMAMPRDPDGTRGLGEVDGVDAPKLKSYQSLHLVVSTCATFPLGRDEHQDVVAQLEMPGPPPEGTPILSYNC